jgi:hypothetical protein
MGLVFLASGQQLAVFVVKDRPLHNFSALERISKSTICSPNKSTKKEAAFTRFPAGRRNFDSSE